MSDWSGSFDASGGGGSWLGSAGSWLGNNANWLLPLGMAGASIYGAMSNRDAANTQAQALQAAGQQQAQSAADATNFLRYAYDTSRGDQAPYRQAGYNALNVMAPQVLGGFQTSPGYQFAQNEAMRGVQNSAAARGMLNSGATLKALQDRSAQLANQEYGNYWNRLASMAGIGQTGVNASSQAAQQFGQGAAGVQSNLGNSLAGLTAQQGLVQANGQTGMAGALMGGANNLLGYYARTQGF